MNLVRSLVEIGLATLEYDVVCWFCMDYFYFIAFFLMGNFSANVLCPSPQQRHFLFGLLQFFLVDEHSEHTAYSLGLEHQDVAWSSIL